MPYQPETWNIIDAAIVGHKIAKFKFNDLKQNKKMDYPSYLSHFSFRTLNKKTEI